jgi:hypothetical protein
MHHTTTHALYTCLSYTWGQPDPKQLILINGRRFYVQPNLFEFLDVIGTDPELQNSHYWIDALCIDQINAAERNHQVTQMGSIYAKAQLVVAWLGPISTQPSLHPAYQYSAPPIYSTIETMYWTGIACNEYWSRAWIPQELVLARRISIRHGSMATLRSVVK